MGCLDDECRSVDWEVGTAWMVAINFCFNFQLPNISRFFSMKIGWKMTVKRYLNHNLAPLHWKRIYHLVMFVLVRASHWIGQRFLLVLKECAKLCDVLQ